MREKFTDRERRVGRLQIAASPSMSGPSGPRDVLSDGFVVRS